MGVDREIELLERQPVLNRQRGLRDQVRGAGADDVRPEQLARPRVGDDLGEAFRLSKCQRPARGREGKPAYAYVQSLVASVLLSQPDVCDLRLGVDAVRNRVIVR